MAELKPDALTLDAAENKCVWVFFLIVSDFLAFLRSKLLTTIAGRTSWAHGIWELCDEPEHLLPWRGLNCPPVAFIASPGVSWHVTCVQRNIWRSARCKSVFVLALQNKDSHLPKSVIAGGD